MEDALFATFRCEYSAAETHQLVRGGRLYVEPIRLEVLARMVIDAWHAGEKITIVERFGQRARFCLDVDVCGPDVLTAVDKATFLMLVYGSTRAAFDGVSLTM